MGFDVDAVRKQFPALAEGAAHFDGPGGSQTPQTVADAVASTLTSAVANRGRVTAAERRADDIVVEARRAMADLLGTDPVGIVFGRSMTQLTYDFARTLAKAWRSDDELVVTRLDHDANIRPWVHTGYTVRWVDFDADTGELPVEAVGRAINDRTKLVAITGAANLIGTRPDVAEIARIAHDAGALVYVDGVHLTPHALVDVTALGADFYVCSPYKFYGPHCGVLWGRPELLETMQPDKLLPATDQVPERFEHGTLPYELLAGTTAAVEFLAGLVPEATGSRRDRLVTSMAAMEAYEDGLRVELESRLGEIDGLRFYGHAEHRTPTLLFTVGDLDPKDVSARLGALGVNAPAGSFYAIEASRWLGLGDRGATRAGIAPYTDRSDIDRLVTGVQEIVR
jgi:cysteine desulfurase family protein (TIGR01976 family)